MVICDVLVLVCEGLMRGRMCVCEDEGEDECECVCKDECDAHQDRCFDGQGVLFLPEIRTRSCCICVFFNFCFFVF